MAQLELKNKFKISSGDLLGKSHYLTLPFPQKKNSIGKELYAKVFPTSERDAFDKLG